MNKQTFLGKPRCMVIHWHEMIECKNGFNSPPLPVSKPLILSLRSPNPLLLRALANKMRRSLYCSSSSQVLKRTCTPLLVLLHSWLCLSLHLSLSARTYSLREGCEKHTEDETCGCGRLWRPPSWHHQKLSYPADLAWKQRYMKEPSWDQKVFPDKPNFYSWPTKLRIE